MPDDYDDVQAHQLEGKHNYFDWRRHFDRAAKAKDLWDLLTGQEKILKEPHQDDHIVYTTDKPLTRNDTKTGLTREIDGPRTMLRWEVAYKKWETNREKVKQARQLLFKSVSTSIAIEIEDERNPFAAATYLKQTYGVSDERARAQLLDKVNKLKLRDCVSITDFINKHRELKQDLIRAKHTYTTGQMITNILMGLPKTYDTFQHQWDWIRAQDLDKEPDLHFFIDRLLIEEQSVQQAKKVSEGPRKNDTKVCGTCKKKGHTEEKCWVAHPDLKPQAVKDREAKQARSDNNNNNKTTHATKDDNKTDRPKKVAAVLNVDSGVFEATLQQALQRNHKPARKSSLQSSNRFAVLDDNTAETHVFENNNMPEAAEQRDNASDLNNIDDGGNL
ncbi:hypothetical protein N0V92_004659 [Colletotrichum tropicale]|nr:hypothetical protein N0V92_004659 [Colletotrichum tropicale]